MDGFGLPPRHLQRLGAALGQAAQDVFGHRAECLAGRGEFERVGGALEQGGAQPFLQRLDAAAQGRLGDVAAFGGTGEAALLGDGYEILQPDQVHDTVLSLNHANSALAPETRPAHCSLCRKTRTNRASKIGRRFLGGYHIGRRCHPALTCGLHAGSPSSAQAILARAVFFRGGGGCCGRLAWGVLSEFRR